MKLYSNLEVLELKIIDNEYYLFFSNENVSNYPDLFKIETKFFELKGNGSGEVIEDFSLLKTNKIKVKVDKSFSNNLFNSGDLIFYSSEVNYKEHLPVELLDSKLVDVFLLSNELQESTYLKDIDFLRSFLSLSVNELKDKNISNSMYNFLNNPVELTSTDYLKIIYNDKEVDQVVRQFCFSQSQFKQWRGSEIVLKMIDYFFNLRLKIQFLYTKDYKTFKSDPVDLKDIEGEVYLTNHYQIGFITPNFIVDGNIQRYIELLFKMFLSLRFVKYSSVLTAWTSTILNIYSIDPEIIKTQWIQKQSIYYFNGGGIYEENNESFVLDGGDCDLIQKENKYILDSRSIIFI